MKIRTSLTTVRRALDMKAAGASCAAIAAELGVADTTVFKWVRYAETQGPGWPTPAEVEAREAEDLALAERRAHRAAVQLAYTKRRYLLRGERLMIPALGTARRLQALAAIGWTCHDLAAPLGVSPTRVGHLMAETYPEVRRDTASRVAKLYDDLSMRVPSDPESAGRGFVRVHARQRRMAAVRGWAPPLAWDDIDDPDENPTGTRRSKEPTRAEALTELDELGADVFEVCRRLGLRSGTLQRWCERNGMVDVYERLMCRATERVA